jgi:hypothetical protein
MLVFLEDAVELCVACIPLDIDEMMMTLYYLFGGRESVHRGNMRMSSGYYAPGNGRTSSKLVDIIAKFVDSKGFDRVLERVGLLQRTTPLTMRGVVQLLAPFVEARYLLQRVVKAPVLDAFINGLKDGVLTGFLELPDEHYKTLSRAMLAKPLMMLEDLLQLVVSRNDVKQTLEVFDLGFSLRLLRCPFLDKRIQAINDIKDMADIVMRKDFTLKKSKGVMSMISNVTGQRDYVQTPRRQLWITAEFLCDWILEEKVCEVRSPCFNLPLLSAFFWVFHPARFPAFSSRSHLLLSHILHSRIS